MQEKYVKVCELLEKYNQTHLLHFYDVLEQDEKSALLDDILSIDFELMKNLKENNILSENQEAKIEPLESTSIKDYSLEEYNRIFNIGKDIILSGKYAVITMAGGQGTRLGHDGPKGTFKLKLKDKEKYIFEIFIENFLKIHEKYDVYIPWYVMTSNANHDETVIFFEKNNYFNYPKEKICFFKQGELPITTTTGDIVLEKKDKVFKAADGNGGIFNALDRNNIIDSLKQENVEWVLVTGVDNILVNLADEFYIGLVKTQGKLNGVKSIVKNYPEEKLGVFCKNNNKPYVIEYSEMDNVMLNETDNNGRLKYGDANIVNHLLNINVLDKIKKEKLPIHKAVKKLDYIATDGSFVKSESPNLLKYEAFIFDYFYKVDDVTIYRVKREDEFAPIKNKEGVDSPSTATKLYDDFWFGGSI